MSGDADIITGWPEPPRQDEIEISIFGPGYGESVLVHLGARKWMIVDSCVEYGTTTPMPIRYLNALGVEPDAVKMIVATHWHDDHVRGMSDLVRAYPEARFVSTVAMSHTRLSALARYSDAGTTRGGGLFELAEVDRLIHEEPSSRRRRSFLLAEARMTLLKLRADPHGWPGQVTALSPSTEDVRRALRTIDRLLPPDPLLDPDQVPEPSTNDSSIVVHIEIGRRSLLLGADLELRASATQGWKAAVATGQELDLSKADVFKVAHHGSRNGDHTGIWQHLLAPEPVALLAPFDRLPEVLPRRSDADRILQRTPRAFASSRLRAINKARDRPSRPGSATDNERRIGITRFPLDTPIGQVRARASVSGDEPWTIAVHPPAGRLSSFHR